MTTGERRNLLLHICCAPDATVPWPALREEGWDVIGYFYGSNIHPEPEWMLRTDAVKKLAKVLDLPLLLRPYNPGEWLTETSELDMEPEGGMRCARCFDIQLRAGAQLAAGAGCDALCTTLTISPHKDPALLNAIGWRVSAQAGIEWVERIWRKGDGFARSVRLSRDYGLYRQNYCGCSFSFHGEFRGVPTGWNRACAMGSN